MLLDDLRDGRGYCHLKEEALNRTMWRNRFGGGIGDLSLDRLLNEIYIHIYICVCLSSSGQGFWLQIQRSRVRFPALPDFLSGSGSGTGSTQPREVN